MPEINILSPHVADLIAAGEVVERPASVVKELMENSFDAGAKNITVELRGGGMTYIRVTDDGCGMLPEDAGVCFLRHATSKLKNERGLESIGTMGFRGEALAAISSVSRIELLTHKHDADVGTRIMLEGGDLENLTPHGCPVGTTMIVRDLFFNTPARLKFMKSDRTEGSACTNAALRCALGRPDISVKLIKDNAEVFFSPGDGKLSSCVYSLLGREIAAELMEFSSRQEKLSVTGFVGSPRFGHGNRGKQYLFLNGRCIRSQMLTAAVEQAYKNTLLTGRYPSCVVYIDVPPAQVDVNVHPAKTEVRFREERKVFDAVHYAALSALQNEGKGVSIDLSPSTKTVISPKKDFFQTMTSADFRKSQDKKAGHDIPQTKDICHTPLCKDLPLSQEREAVPSPSRGTVVWDRTPRETSRELPLRESCTPFGMTFAEKATASSSAPAPLTNSPLSDAPYTDAPLIYTDSEKASASEEQEPATIVPNPSFRLIGETMKTYILAETEQGLLLIDKHAAHERMLFDKLKAQDREIMSQSLMLPEVMNLSGEDTEILEKNTELLTKLGFEIEPFGASSIAVRAVPADTDVSEIPALIEEICDKLRKGGLSPDERTDELLHTIACKAAIKAGWNTDEKELSSLVEEVVSGRIKYCPHGRPVSVTFTRKQLDKEFSRIV